MLESSVMLRAFVNSRRPVNSPVMRMLSVTSRTPLVVVLIILCAGAHAAPVDCPTVSVACSEGLTIQFTATVSPENPELKLTYQWTVTRGETNLGRAHP